MKYRWINFVLFCLLSTITPFAHAYEIDFYTYSPNFDTTYNIMHNGTPVPLGMLVQVIRPGVLHSLSSPRTSGSLIGAPGGFNVLATHFAIGEGTNEDGTWCTTLNGCVGAPTGDQLQSGTTFYIRVWLNVLNGTAYPFPSGSSYCDGGPYVVPDSVNAVSNPPTSLGLHNIQVNPNSASPTWPVFDYVLPVCSVSIGGNVVPDPVDFGTVVNGTHLDTTFHIMNTGTAPLIVTNLTATGDYAVQGNTSDTIAVGSAQDVVVRFTPTVFGTRTGTFSFTHNAPGSPATFNLTGYALIQEQNPLLTTLINNFPVPIPVDYGTVFLGTYSDITFQLINSGTGDLHVAALSATGDYTVQGNTAYTIAPGNSQDVVVRFTPTALGTRTGTFSFNHDGLAGPSPATFNLTGNSYAIPSAPENLSVTIDGADAVLSWSRVDSSVSGFPMTVSGYLLYSRISYDSPWLFLNSISDANTTSFTDVNAISTQPAVYYNVTAWSGSSSSTDRVLLTIPRGTPETEVHRILYGSSSR